ncbi:MAG: helix-turn-helix domain-containing protein [Planctomycetes bacterium]|nr:helix-turn-helix domain-containing protein [Planctomycetota bacterium]
MTYTPDKLLTAEEAAEMLGIAQQTLSVWRSSGRYKLAYIKVGRNVRYRKSEIERFLEQNTVTHTGEAED